MNKVISPSLDQFWRESLLKKRYLHVLAVVAVVVITVLIFVFRRQVVNLRSLGYLGIFLLELIATASVVLPLPGAAAVVAGGSLLNPVLVAIVAGFAEPIGELTGYLAGYGGESVVERARLFQKVCHLMRSRWGDLIIFLFSAIPNPLFDVAGIAAGATGYPIWRFLLICWAGKTVKSAGLAFMGYFGMTAIVEFIHHYHLWPFF